MSCGAKDDDLMLSSIEANNGNHSKTLGFDEIILMTVLFCDLKCLKLTDTMMTAVYSKAKYKLCRCIAINIMIKQYLPTC